MTPTVERSIYHLLESVRARPGMYLSQGKALRELETYVWGYVAALEMHQVAEKVPSMGRPFGAWLRLRNPTWSLAAGWAAAIERHTDPGASAFESFFDLIDEYKALRLEILADVALPQREATTCFTSAGKPIAAPIPKRVQVLRYHPTKLHVSRVFYLDVMVEEVIYGNNASLEISFEEALTWTRERFKTMPLPSHHQS